MNDFPEKKKKREENFIRQITSKERRKETAKRVGKVSLVYGLGMVGLVGWSVAIPTLMGIWIGMWMDERLPSQHSWTLTMLFIGLILGCINAWYWVRTMLRIRGSKKTGNRHIEP